jgi:hypothetical protein
MISVEDILHAVGPSLVGHRCWEHLAQHEKTCGNTIMHSFSYNPQIKYFRTLLLRVENGLNRSLNLGRHSKMKEK